MGVHSEFLATGGPIGGPLMRLAREGRRTARSGLLVLGVVERGGGKAGSQEPSGSALPEEWACCCGVVPGALESRRCLPTSVLSARGERLLLYLPFPPEDNLTVVNGAVAGRAVCQERTLGEFGVF